VDGKLLRNLEFQGKDYFFCVGMCRDVYIYNIYIYIIIFHNQSGYIDRAFLVF